jgi:hypothetical protein
MLIRQTAGSSAHIEFRSGKGVNTGGFDGDVLAPIGVGYVPEGESVWEVSTEDDPSKAERDYTRRTNQEPAESRLSKSYVGVSLRRWAGKGAWLKEKQQAQEWKTVHFYDADNLAEWLESQPPVHYWLSNKRGKPALEACTLDAWWEGWSFPTKPIFGSDWLLAGRDSAKKATLSQVNSTSEWFCLTKAPQEECIAFLYSAIMNSDDAALAEYLLARTMIVASSVAWNALSIQPIGLLLVPKFNIDNEQIGNAMKNKHRVILCDLPGQPEKNAIELPKPNSEELHNLLRRDGVPFEKALQAARSARTSIHLMRRDLGAPPVFFKLAGAGADDNSLITALLLLNRWDGQNERDRSFVALLTGREYSKVESAIGILSEQDPPLFRKSGTVWFLTDDGLAWNQLQNRADESILEAYVRHVADLLSESDPLFAIPARDRWKAGLQDLPAKHSHHLKSGLTRSLAILATSDLQFNSRSTGTGSALAEAVVHSLLNKATSERWFSLARFLSNLAEAAPATFLNQLEKDLGRKSPHSVAGLYAKDTDALTGGSPHYELLWALERLAWSKQFLLRAALLLARLASLGFASSSGNSPKSSLRSILLPWCPNTDASVSERIAVVNTIRRTEPDVAWSLLLSLLPTPHDVGTPTSRPEIREWGRDGDMHPTYQDMVQAQDQFLTWAIADAGKNVERWKALTELAMSYQGIWFERFCVGLEEADSQITNDTDRAALWEALRAQLTWHKRTSTSEWSMQPANMDRFEKVLSQFSPDDAVRQVRWLFDQWVRLEEDEEDVDPSRLNRLRTDAVLTVYQARGKQGIYELADAAGAPGYVGQALAYSDLLNGEVENTCLLEWLASPNSSRRMLARGYVFGKLDRPGRQWIEEKLTSSIGQKLTVVQRAELLISLPFDSSAWALVEQETEETQQLYWSQIQPWSAATFTLDEVEYFLNKLLDYDQEGRALDWLATESHRSSRTIPSTLALRALEQLRSRSGLDAQVLINLRQDISRVLEVLSDDELVDLSQLLALEFYFLPVFGYSHVPRAIGKAMRIDPSAFVHLLSLAFRANGEKPRELSEENQMRARIAYRALDGWRDIPGATETGEIEADQLKAWVNQARALARRIKRLNIAENFIGKTLARFPADKSGSWPHEAICRILESSKSKACRDGFVTGVVNQRGTTARSYGSGGDLEREEANRFREYANHWRFTYPKTSQLLDEVADYYLRIGNLEDVEADMRQDL